MATQVTPSARNSVCPERAAADETACRQARRAPGPQGWNPAAEQSQQHADNGAEAAADRDRHGSGPAHRRQNLLPARGSVPPAGLSLQRQRCDTGTEFITLSMCWPQPSQPVLPQDGQRTR